MSHRILAAAACIVACSFPRVAAAALAEKTGTFAGAKVTYEVVTTAGFDPARAYPNEDHIIRAADLPARLFEEIESRRR